MTGLRGEPGQAPDGYRARYIYDEPSAEDGTRVLVDRIWPRGTSKGAAHLDDWMKMSPRPRSCGLVLNQAAVLAELLQDGA